MCILIEFLSRAHAKGWKSQKNFRFCILIGHFPSDRAASMAVKGLNSSIISNETRAPEVNNLSRRQKIAIVALVSPLLTKKAGRVP